jgi:hypothetical protein
VDGLLQFIATSIATSIGNLSESTAQKVISAMLCERAIGEPTGMRHTVAANIREACDPPLNDSGKFDPPVPALTVFKKAVKQLPAPDQLVAWLSLLRSIHRELNDNNVERPEYPLLVVIDNLDPVDSSIQSGLLRTLMQMTSGPSWGKMRIVLGMRLSTYQQHMGALRFNAYDHEAADPSEMVLIRTVLALLAPDAYGSFKKASPRAQSAAYDALFELFSHMVDAGGHFSELLSAMSGTCIRHALSHAHRWCLSPRNGLVAQDAWKKHEFQQRLMEIICANYLEQLASRIGRESRKIIQSYANRFDISRTDPELLGLELADGVMHVLRSAEVCREFAGGDQSPRATLGRALQAGLVRELSNTAARPSVRHQTTLRCILRRLMELAISQQVDKSAVDETARYVCARLGEIAATSTLASLSQLICWTQSGLDACTGVRSDLRSLNRQRRVAPAPELSGAADPETSRFDAETLLLASPDNYGRSIPRVLNVFSLDGAQVCPILLRILYLLRYSGQADVTRQHLLQRLACHQYSALDIESGLGKALSLDQRLIYSGLDDYFTKTDEWLSEGTKLVKLSSTGIGYLDVMLGIPSYLQWALSDLRQVRENLREGATDGRNSVRARLRAALEGFSLIIRDEKERLEHVYRSSGVSLKPEYLRVTELPVQSASAHTFFRVLDQFMHVYRVNIENLQGSRTTEAGALARDATEWLRLATTTRQAHQELFQRPTPTWNQAIEHAKVDVAAIQSYLKRGKSTSSA